MELLVNPNLLASPRNGPKLCLLYTQIYTPEYLPGTWYLAVVNDVCDSLFVGLRVLLLSCRFSFFLNFGVFHFSSFNNVPCRHGHLGCRRVHVVLVVYIYTLHSTTMAWHSIVTLHSGLQSTPVRSRVCRSFVTA